MKLIGKNDLGIKIGPLVILHGLHKGHKQIYFRGKRKLEIEVKK